MAPGTSPRRASSPHGTQTWLAVVRAYNLCDAVMGARLATLGLRVGEHEVLAHLARTPGITQQALAERCFVAKSGISMLLTQMEARGLVRREADAADARVRRLQLSAEGQALAERSLRLQAEVVSLMVEGATEAELATVGEVMTRVAQRLAEEQAAQAAAAAPRRLRSRSGA